MVVRCDECELPGPISLINCIRKQTDNCEVSNIVYVEILNEISDSKPTIMTALGKLYTTFILKKQQKWLLVVGDAKIFVLLHELKREYGSHLSWMLPFPGDWHILFNYQPALLKPYADAGLSKLAEVSGHHSETLTSLIQCKNFRRTHNFLVQLFTISKHGMFFSKTENEGLWNFLEGKEAMEEQSHDLLNFRKTGQQSFENFVMRSYIKSASTEAPVRRKRLCTFTIKPTQKRKIKQIEHERRLYQRYLKRSLAWVAEHGTADTDTESLFCPIQSKPRALVDKDGLPYKANKSATTIHIGQRYKIPQQSLMANQQDGFLKQSYWKECF